MSSRTQIRRMTLMSATILTLAGTPAVFAAAPLPPMHTMESGEISYISGGVGETERDTLIERSGEYRLLVSFASSRHGAYLSGVDVTLTGSGSHASSIDLTTAGPLLLMSLPAGDYKLTASLPGWQSVQRHVEIRPGSLQQVYIVLDPAQS